VDATTLGQEIDSHNAKTHAMKLSIEGGEFHDEYGRTVLLRGINVAGDSKFPKYPSVGGGSSYVGSPFPLEEADEHFARLKSLGYNVVR
jgi:hypothetical protein